MKRIKIIAGIAWAFAGLLLIVILFPGLNNFSALAARLPFMKINPNYSGGEVSEQYISARCTLDIRKPVFDGLIGQRKRGFVQLEWRGDIPETIIDTIDYDLDNNPDFVIFVDRNLTKTSIKQINIKVEDVGISTPTSYGWLARINLEK